MENMEKIGLVKASKLTSPNPVSLFCTLRPDGGTNMAAISWWTFVSFAPDLLAVAMMKNGYSGELFRASGEAILTVPGVSLQEIALKCGTSTGRKTDKIKQFGIQTMPFEGSQILVPKGIRLALHLKLKEYYPTGTHYLHICEVASAWANENVEAVFAYNGYENIKPLH